MNHNNSPPLKPQDHVMVQLALGANLISQKEINRMVKINSNNGDLMISLLSVARERILKKVT